MSFILVFVSKRIPSAGGGVEGDEDDADKDDLLGTLEFVFAAAMLNANVGDIITIPMLIVMTATIKKLITDTLNIVPNARLSD
jgi:hypothetical protein